MADIIKKVKVMQPGGTFTDYIPLGADAADVRTEDGMSVENKLKKKPYYFDTVADMKAANYLAAGDMAITLGYYQANDGGHGEYVIVDDETLVDDGGFIHTLSNGLRAKLIYNGEINIKQFGATGDGTTDDSIQVQNALNYENVYINEGNYYCSQSLYVNSNTKIYGRGTLIGNLEIIGEIGESVNYTTLEKNKINGDTNFNLNEMLLIYYEDNETPTNNKRQVVTTSSINGKLSNNLCNYTNNYLIKKINSIKNIHIYDITLIGNIIINYGQDIYMDKITVKNGTITIKSSYNINVLNGIMQLGNNNRIDGNSGSSNLTFENLKFLGGNTPSDNGALKLNEVFYSYINNCNFGSPANEITGYTGNFHAIMIDGNFAEDNYPLNQSQYIDINNIKVADGYTNSLFITLGKNINVNNFSGYYIHLKYSDIININNSITNILNNEIENTNLNFENCIINTITSGTRQNMNFTNCIIDDFALAKNTNNNNFINCKINKLRNTYINVDSAKNIHFENCEIFETCQLSGINKCTGSIKSHVFVQVNQLNNSNVSILIVDNDDTTYNLSMQNCDNSKIFYQILDDALTNTPVNNLVDGLRNKIETINLVKSNNPNNNVTQAILKANGLPITGTHYKGEILLNSNPSAGGYIGWICLVGGEPGTWKQFGLIES